MSGSFLRQATASQSRSLGPFVDDTDFVTPETGLTIANTDIKLIANGGASADKNSGGGTHRANGIYGVTFNATDTAAVGELRVSALVSGALLVSDKYTVLAAAEYDARFGADAPGLDIQTAATGTTGTITFALGATADSDRNGGMVYIFAGTGAGQAGRTITGWVNSTKVATISPPWVTPPDNTSKFVFIPAAPATTTSVPHVIVDSTATGAIVAASFAAGAIDASAIASNAIAAAKIASGAITNAKFAAGAIDATAIASDAITAAKIASAAITNAKFHADTGKL